MVFTGSRDGVDRESRDRISGCKEGIEKEVGKKPRWEWPAQVDHQEN